MFFSTLVRVVLSGMLVVVIAAMAISVGKAGHELITTIHEPLEVILRNILLDVVFVLALLELTIITLGYLKDGRVHVRYIVDAVLIIILNEVVTTWFTKVTLEKSLSLAIIMLVLVAVRIGVTRFAPSKDD